MKNRIIITVAADEREELEGLAIKAGLSLTNFVRKCLGFGPLAHGGVRENAGRRKEIVTANIALGLCQPYDQKEIVNTKKKNKTRR